MARRTTLKDLNEFLNQNPNEIELDDVKTKDDFLNKSPKNLVSINKKSKSIVNSASSIKNASVAEIADYIHKLAKKEDKSFADIWLKVIEEGSKTDPLLKNTSAFKMIRRINSTTFNVALEGVTKLITRRK